MNTSRAGSRSSWPSNQFSRALRTSARSCSTACPVFFARDAVSGEEAVQRRDHHRHACLAQLATQLVQRDVAPCFVQRQHRLPMRFDPPRPRVPALRLGGVGARAAALVVPPDHRRGRHTEPHRRSPATHPLVNRAQRSRPKIHRQRLAHPRRPPSSQHRESDQRVFVNPSSTQVGRKTL